MTAVKNDLFDYPNRYIYQDDKGFKFSLDSLLLAEYVKVYPNFEILDMCTGNAPIPLVLSLKTNSHITGVEIQKNIANLAKDSVKLNNLDKQITIINDDIKNIGKYFPGNNFDIIVCNPPFFKVSSSSYTNISDELKLARHEVTITLEQIFSIASNYLKSNGTFYLVQRATRIDEIIIYANKYKMNVKELVFIRTKIKDNPRIVLVKCKKNSNFGIIVRKEINVNNLTTYQHLFD